MTNFGVIDIETLMDNDKFIPYCLCVLIKGKITTFYGMGCVNEFLLWFEKNCTSSVIYAHNLSFDGAFLIESLDPTKFSISGHYFRSSIYSLEITSLESGSQLKLRCSHKLLPLPLRKIGNLLDNNLPKLEFPHHFVNKTNLFYIGDHPQIKNEKWNLKENCIEYCKRDVKIVYNLIRKIISDKRISHLVSSSQSISSLSLKVFNKYFNSKKIETKFEMEWDNLIRESYFGGRCEVFGNPRKDEKLFHFDFSGMYSQVMLEKFCFGRININNSPTSITKPGFYNVTILSTKMEIPILPYRDAESKKLLFPNGKWRGTYWWEELDYFIQNGGQVIKIHYSIEFEKYEHVFNEFISHFQSLRTEGPFSNIFWKMFINSLSGRFGMSPETEKNTIVLTKDEYNKLLTKKIKKEKWINNIGIITWEDTNQPSLINSNVSIASSITSKARIKLHKAYISTIKNGGRILYSDTDSVFAAFSRDVLNETHSEVTWNEKIDDAVFAVPKGYALMLKGKEIIKLKGFHRTEITFDHFKESFYSDLTISLIQEHFKTSNFIPFLKKIEKNTKLTTYNKRTFIENKTSTLPLWVYA